jgi:hypothetical protein
MKIMMSAAASPVATSIIRHLQQLGHYVIGHDSSEYVEKTEADKHVRSPSAKGGKYLRFLRNFEKTYDLYLPFLDEELRFFAIAGVIENCLCSPIQTLLTFTDKGLQQLELERADLPVAPRAEVVWKPGRGRGGKGIIRSDLMAGSLVQRRIMGLEFTIDVLCDLDGKFLYALPRERLSTNGVSVVGRVRHHEMHVDLVDLAQKITERFSFAGPINIQVIIEDGEPFIIEVNPRLSGSCIFTAMAGWDILDASIRVFEGKPFVTPEISEVTIRRHYVEEII